MHRGIEVALAIWTFFFIGQALHVWLRASLIVASPLNGIKSYEAYVRLNAPALLIRYFLATLGLIFWAWNPNAFSTLAKYVGWNLTLNVPQNIVTAGVYGYFSDSVIDLLASKYPPLQHEIPPVGGLTISEKEVKTETTSQGVTETTKEKETVLTPPPTEVTK